MLFRLLQAHKFLLGPSPLRRQQFRSWPFRWQTMRTAVRAKLASGADWQGSAIAAGVDGGQRNVRVLECHPCQKHISGPATRHLWTSMPHARNSSHRASLRDEIFDCVAKLATKPKRVS